MNYSREKNILRSFYEQHGLLNEFENDIIYLEEAFNDIYNIWLENFNKIESVNYLMLSEAPLWGEVRKYIYNPDINNSQFFYRSDLECVLNKRIADKKEFIQVCNEIGLVVVDISPFPLNSKYTKINYRKSENGSKKLNKTQYKQLVKLTIPTFFNEKIKLIAEKKSTNIKTFFRYSRVKNNFENIVAEVLIGNGFIETLRDIGDISKRGGGIDRMKLKHITEQV